MAELLLDFTYTDTGVGITITDYPDTAVGEVEIPAEIAGKPVTAIGPQAFAACAGITSVAIPASVTSIGDQAFFNCGELVSAPIPAAVASLGTQAFANCGNLTTMTIPAGVTSIGDNLFAYCGKLASVTLHEGITGIGINAFASCQALTSLTLPQTLKTVGNTAFIYCSGLTSLSLPEGVTSIGDSCFAQCTALAEVSLPSTLKSIGTSAFLKCISLPSITIPSSVNSIGLEAFRACSSLTSIEVEAGNLYFRSVGGVLFNQLQTTLIAYPGGLGGAYEIPAGVSAIGRAAFRSCAALTAVRIPDSVTRIDSSAFSGCSLLATATFAGNAPTTFGTFVFPTAGFFIRFYPESTGFTTPSWKGYVAVEIGSVAEWLASKGLPVDSDLNSDSNGDGVSLLMAYALDLDPNQNLSASMPQPVLTPGTMTLSFKAATPGVVYAVETSTNLTDWTTEGVGLTDPDENQVRTATVNRSGPGRFLRLVVSQ